ncbi:MAG: LapA family protein [Desulfatiglandaceae bacterium]|jgi:lipopolysaccharide assembly protein A
MKHVRVVLVILFVLLIITVAVQNYSVMASQVNFRLNLLFFNHETPPMSLYLVVIIAFLLGVVFTGFYGITERFRLKKEIRMLMKESRGKDQELQSLRNLPVTAEEMRSGGEQDVE